MVQFWHDDLLDNGINNLHTYGDKLYICNAQPDNYADTLTYSLGYKEAPTIGAPENGASTGRRVRVSAITDGVVSVNDTDLMDTATHYAIVDVSATKLLLAAPLSAGQVVTDGNTFTLAEISVTIPDPTA